MKSAVLIAALAGIVSAQAPPWGQCGGQGWDGPTTCTSGWTCVASNQWYSQCIQGTGGGGTTTTTTTTTTRLPTTPTNPPTGNCGSASVNQLVGFGAGTTGGGSGTGVTVTSCSALRSALANGGVIRISGTLTGCGRMDVQPNTSLLGVGSSSGLRDGGFRLRRISNVIIRNLNFRNPAVGDDIISLDQATRVWIDHCDIGSQGITGDKDYYDGLLDITHASDYVTVSWTKFHDHWKGSLIGHSDSNSGEDTGHLRVTYHHNLFSNINSRLPSLRFGTGHFYSSCYENNPTSGINSRMGANVLVEHSSFINTRLAIVTDLDSSSDGYATQRNNLFSSSDTRITRTSSFTPPYSYTADPASCICSHVRSLAGTGVITV
ncbi:hypothetical protein S40285_05987 [Stachybotrys chlorohalonatus IBT 40285]|uniref:CBM1 domain-containing protein n=1 Tax=Stachybotrys chlorohalonatus (strain IBT 40285) TaxID=1283841 RepID=A0A084QBH8_STAC4|nr:hypothetical protein S40285_05987 [Stachybotrys chlorohalonata IBT 40285]